jgi:hypothetical protein
METVHGIFDYTLLSTVTESPRYSRAAVRVSNAEGKFKQTAIDETT